jgi:UDP-glucose 4-epimerase
MVFEKSIIAKHNIDYPINLAFGNPVTLNQILKVFRAYFGTIEVQYREIRNGDIRDSESNPKSLMNLHESKLSQTTLENGLLKTFDWFKHRYNY